MEFRPFSPRVRTTRPASRLAVIGCLIIAAGFVPPAGVARANTPDLSESPRLQDATSSAAYPFRADPLGLVAHYNLSFAPPYWKVYACDVGSGYYLPDAEQGVASWGPKVQAWFDWASQGSYIPQFVVTDPISVTSQSRCDSEPHVPLTPEEVAKGVGVIALTNAQPSVHDTGKNQGALGYGFLPSFKTAGSGLDKLVRRSHNRLIRVRMNGDGIDEAYRASLFIHEMGHALGWQHAPYHHLPDEHYAAPNDVMSMLRYAPTHAFNRYRAGWLDPSLVLFHTQPSQTVHLGYPGSGSPEMLVLADPDTVGKVYAFGVNPGTVFPSIADLNSSAGVDLFIVDQSASSPAARSRSEFCVAGTADEKVCSLLGASTSLWAPEDVEVFQPYAMTPGSVVTVGGVTVTVAEETSSGYTLNLEGSPVGFWGRDHRLTSARGQFTDVPPGHLFFSEIHTLYVNRLTFGCVDSQREFCPDRRVTRGEMASFLVRLLDLAPSGNPDRFLDTAGRFYAADAEAAAAAGITRGCNPPKNDRFCGDRYLTRGEAAVMFARALGLSSPAAPRFKDTGGVFYASEAAAVASVGITRGCNPPANDRFCGHRHLTRGEMAAFIVRASHLLP